MERVRSETLPREGMKMTAAISEHKQEASKKPETVCEPRTGLGLPTLTRLRREFDDLWNRFFTEMPALWGAERTDHRWAFHVEDQADAYVIRAEVPGFDPHDFDVELRGDQLVLQAKKAEKKKKEKMQQPLSASEFYHAMTIPPFVDRERIAASYKQGILEVSLPKTEEGKGRKIPVKG
jgi:HSP20 family protein